MYDIVFPELIKLLGNMHTYFDKAAAHADQKKYDVNNLLEARLTPDQYNLRKQIQTTCFLAIECAARVAGKVPPVFENNEVTFADLRQRVDKTIAYLKGLTPKDFQGWEERNCDIFFLPGKYLTGYEYLTQLGVPNVYFHLVTVYSILRHNGVDVGKLDYLGSLSFKDKKH